MFYFRFRHSSLVFETTKVDKHAFDTDLRKLSCCAKYIKIASFLAKGNSLQAKLKVGKEHSSLNLSQALRKILLCT